MAERRNVLRALLVAGAVAAVALALPLAPPLPTSPEVLGAVALAAVLPMLAVLLRLRRAAIPAAADAAVDPGPSGVEADPGRTAPPPPAVGTPSSDRPEDAETASGRVASLATALRQLADRLEELAGGASASADEGRGHATAVAAAVEELSAAIAVIGENGARSARASEEVVEESRQLTDALAVLGASADAIEGIVETVREVAEKTRILSLNAAIEAARVGEAGRGFAVVAGEVKALARRTAEATAGIEQRIAAMREALGRVERVAATLDSGARTASEAAAAIAAAVEEQSAAAEEISVRVRAIANASEELADVLGSGSRERPGLLALARELEQDAERLEAEALSAAGRRAGADVSA